jgi:hypothetical protein
MPVGTGGAEPFSEHTALLRGFVQLHARRDIERLAAFVSL